MLAPAARARSWQVQYPVTHWVGFLTWVSVFWLAHRFSARRLPERDPFLLPIVGLLSGWGILTITRLEPGLGLRQTAWLIIAAGILILGTKLPKDLSFLRRYKYLWLTGGLGLTALTLVFGTNPLGTGPQLWLGCCGLYLQPSEPLKLLLVIFLSAYLADRQLSLLPLAIKGSTTTRRSAWFLLPLLAPTLVITGLTMLLLVVQRDLGTATIFLFLYTAMVFIATGLLRFIWPSFISIGLAGLAGYILFDVVRLRIDAWLNPWADPSGRSYQIVQSLIAAANGGLFGRGPGMGNPGLVPVPHSDFIFVAIVEETGLIGAALLIGLLALLTNRGLRISLRAPNIYHRYLAAGLTVHLAGQSILIIGGNLRLFPLTGVTLPFISYGGSSLVTSFVSLLILILISSQSMAKPTSLPRPMPYLSLNTFLSTGFAATLLITGWWSIFRAPTLLARTDNARRSIADRFVQRGTIKDRNNQPLAVSNGDTGKIKRNTLFPGLGPVLGYVNPVYGQSGLEDSLDSYLRGTSGNPGLLVWWNNLLYGQPPAGLDVRISLDIQLQEKAYLLLKDHRGALVLLNAESGEILAMVSYPDFDPNLLDQEWPSLINDPAAPLLNRATLGQFPVGAATGPLLLAAAYQSGSLPPIPASISSIPFQLDWGCTEKPSDSISWEKAVTLGCPGAISALGEHLGVKRLYEIYAAAGFFTPPQINLPTAASTNPGSVVDAQRAALGFPGYAPDPEQQLLVSPLQMAIAAATISSSGNRPSPRLVMAVDTPQAGWSIMPIVETGKVIFPAPAAQSARQALTEPTGRIWYSFSSVPIHNANQGPSYTWFIGGTSSAWQGSPLALALVLEEDNATLAQSIGRDLLNHALLP